MVRERMDALRCASVGASGLNESMAGARAGEKGGCVSFFFFQAEDGIRDHCVTGVQTCALPISIFANLDWRKLRVGYLKTAFERRPDNQQEAAKEEPPATPEEQKKLEEQKKRRDRKSVV